MKTILDEGGFNGGQLIEQTNDPKIKSQLATNTRIAYEKGVIGLPTYEIDEYIIWGQDRIDLVQDILCGWKHSHKERSTISRL